MERIELWEAKEYVFSNINSHCDWLKQDVVGGYLARILGIRKIFCRKV
jgi:hypothetical protein